MFIKTIFASLLIYLSIMAFAPLLVSAQGLVPPDTKTANSCPAGYVGNCGNYQLDDFIVLAVKVSKWILGIVGSLTLVMFIYGGFMFMISAGSSSKIDEARKIIVAAVVGLLIVMASFLIIQFVLSSMGLSWDGGQKISNASSTPTNSGINNTVATPDLCQTTHPGYSCMDDTDQPDCYTGLCKNQPANIRCCNPNSGS